MNTIAIDCGASFIKAAYISDGVIINKIEKKSPKLTGKEDILEPVGINRLVDMIKEIMDELVCGETVKLIISNEMHGFILAYENGKPFTDYISWQKELGSVELLSELGLSEDISRTGMPLRAGLPSCNLLFLKENGILDGVDSKLMFFTLGDYLLRQLSQKSVYINKTNAAATGMYDIINNKWNERIISVCCDNKVVFPTIADETIEFSYNGTKIIAYPAIGDQQAALLGAGLNNESALSFNLGTGAQVSRLVKSVVLSSDYQTRPFFNGYYLKTIPHIPSGRAINVYIRLIQNILQSFGINKSSDEVWKVILDCTDNCGKSKMFFDLSFFENAVSENMCGTISNIGEYDLTLGNLFSGIFEQMSSNFIGVARRIQPDSDNVTELVFSGGIARKISAISNKIIEEYKNAINIKMASNETLMGLYIYGNM